MLLFILAASIVFFVFLPKINGTAGDVSILEDNVETLQEQVDLLEVSIITTPPPAKNAIRRQKGKGGTDKSELVSTKSVNAPREHKECNRTSCCCVYANM